MQLAIGLVSRRKGRHHTAMEAWQYGFALIATLAVGASKTALPGLTIAVVPLTAAAFGGKASVGLMLPWLILADCCALWWFRRHADWPRLRAVLPWLVPGLALGAVMLWGVERLAKEVPGAWSEVDWFQPLIGVVIARCWSADVARKRKARTQGRASRKARPGGC